MIIIYSRHAIFKFFLGVLEKFGGMKSDCTPVRKYAPDLNLDLPQVAHLLYTAKTAWLRNVEVHDLCHLQACQIHQRKNVPVMSFRANYIICILNAFLYKNIVY